MHKSITIDAPRERVWRVLLDKEYTDIWYNEFSEGSSAETDWKLGSKATFKDSSGSGLNAVIVEHKPLEVISMEFTGMLDKGKEITEGEYADQMKGKHETYRLSEKDGQTRIDVEIETDESWTDQLAEMWERALKRLKQLAEEK